MRPKISALSGERGSVVVEFALVALLLSIILAATIDFGRLMFSAQGIQDVARVAARELSVTPLPATITFADALTYTDQDPMSPTFGVQLVKERIFDPACLVVDLDTLADDAAVDSFFATMPLVNKALRAVMILDQPNGRNFLRYPGTLLTDATDPAPSCKGHEPTGFTVSIARITTDSGGADHVDWLNVLEEIPDPACPAGTDPFSLACRGVVALRLNYPFQAAAISGFRPNPDGPLEANIGNPIEANESICDPPGGAALAGDPAAVGAYAGPCGLGRQLAFAKVVRPFRKLISAQAIYRREVFQ